jgi:hypothetical protein
MPDKSDHEQPVRLVSDPGIESELIRKRAYEFYVARGMGDGHDVEDWLRAEEEVLSQREELALAA